MAVGVRERESHESLADDGFRKIKDSASRRFGRLEFGAPAASATIVIPSDADIDCNEIEPLFCAQASNRLVSIVVSLSSGLRDRTGRQKMRCFFVNALVLAFSAFLAAPAFADAAGSGPIGTWNRDDGLGGVRILRCGGALCGHIVWLRNPQGPGRVGQRVLYGMRKTSENTWSGSAHNPEDGGTYSGTMVLSGNRLITRGCAAGGLLCQSVGLSRSR